MKAKKKLLGCLGATIFLVPAMLLPASAGLPDWTVTATVPVCCGPRGVAITPDGSTALMTGFSNATLSVVDIDTLTVTDTIPVGEGPVGVAITPDGSTALVANEWSSTLSVVDIATLSVVATIPVGTSPNSVAITPDGTTALVGHWANPGLVSVVNIASRTVTATIGDVHEWLTGVAITPDGTTAVVAHEAASYMGHGGLHLVDMATLTVTDFISLDAKLVAVTPDGTTALVTNGGYNLLVVDIATLTVVATIRVGDWTWGVAITPDGSTALVVNHYPYKVSVVDMDTLTLTDTIPVGWGPEGVAITPDGNMALVANSSSNSVTVIEPGAGPIQSVYLPLVLKVSGEAPPPGCAPYFVADIGVGDTPRGIAIDPARNRLYVANYGSNSLSVINSSSNAVIQTITGITSANGVAYDPEHNLVWVTNYDSDQVTPIHAGSLAPLSPIAVGDGPWGVAYDQVHDTVYVVNSEGNSVTVIDAGTRTVTGTLNGVFNQPFHVAANPVTGKVYVTNFGDHSVAVLNGTSISSVVNLNVGDPSTQPYGVAVDETRNLVYVATVDSHRIVVIGEDADSNPDQVLGWAALHRGFGDPTRPVPLRGIAVNPDIGPAANGDHVWATTTSADGSEANQALLLPKGWAGYFDYPVPYDVGANPAEGIVVDRARDRVYVSSGSSPGTVTVLGDSTDNCLVPFSVDDGLGFEMFVAR